MEGAKRDGKTAPHRTLRSSFADRTLPIDADVAERWADLSVHVPSLRDGDKAIGATAPVRGFGVATRNTGDFKGSGVTLVNPFDPETWAPPRPSTVPARRCVATPPLPAPPAPAPLQPNRRVHRLTVSARSPDRAATSR